MRPESCVEFYHELPRVRKLRQNQGNGWDTKSAEIEPEFTEDLWRSVNSDWVSVLSVTKVLGLSEKISAGECGVQ